MADLTIEFSTAPRARRERKEGAEALRLVILGDFSGDSPTAPALHGCDPSTFAPLIARLAPQVRLPQGNEEESALLTFRSLADFHPDHLLHQEPLSRLTRLREALDTPAGLAQAMDILQGASTTAPPTSSPEPAPAAPDDAGESSEDTLQRLLGRPSATQAPAGDPKAKARDFVANLLSRQASASAPVESSSAERAREGIDRALTERLRTILATPALQSTESLWRMTEALVSELPLDGAVTVQLLPISKSALADDLLRGSTAPGTSEVERLLQEVVDDGATLLAAAAFPVQPTPADLGWLSRLAAVLVPLGGTLLADACPSLVGAEDFAALRHPDRWQAPAEDFRNAWDALRASPLGAHISLVLPPLLARLPYGQRGEPCDVMRFEEFDTLEERYALWGSGAVALSEAVAERWLASEGGAAHDTGPLSLHDRPHYAHQRHGETQVLPPSRSVLGERSVTALAQQGLTAWVHPRGSTSVHVGALLALNGEPLSNV